MKKKIIFAVATSLFAIATVFNMNVLQSNNAGDVSLESIAVMAQAQNEASTFTGWLYDTFGGKWASETATCVKSGYRDVATANVGGRIFKNGVWVEAEVKNGRERYETTYPYTVCVEGRGNCWSSESC